MRSTGELDQPGKVPKHYRKMPNTVSHLHRRAGFPSLNGRDRMRRCACGGVRDPLPPFAGKSSLKYLCASFRFGCCIMNTATIRRKARLTGAPSGLHVPRNNNNRAGLQTRAYRSPVDAPENDLEWSAFRRWFDSAVDAVVIFDRRGKMLRVNRRTGRMFGYQKIALIGKPIRILFPKLRQFPGRKTRANSGMARRLNPTGSSNELRARRSDGTELPVEVWWDRFRAGFRQFGMVVVRDISERQSLKPKRKRLLHDLGERVKELKALHGLRDVLQRANGATPELLQKVAALLPGAWQYPELTAASLSFGQVHVATSNYVRTPWAQRAEFSLVDGTRGTVEVVYLTRCPKADEGPFLTEERSLINSVAEALRGFFDQRRVEVKLRQSEDRFRSALRHSPIAIFNQDRKMRYTWVYNTNPPSAAQNMLGKTDRELFPREEALLLRRIKQRVLETGESAREEVQLTINDSLVFYDLVIEPLRDSARRVIGITGAAMDITKRKRAETERSFLASIVESSEDAIFVRTLEGTIITWNAGAERMFGYSAPEIVERSVSMLVPTDRAGEVSQINMRIKAGERMDHYETIRLTKDGSRIYVSLTNSPMRGAEGEVSGVSTIARDITKRKHLELEMLEINETLQRRVGRDLHDGLSQQLRGIAYLSHVLEQTLAGKSQAEAREAARINELLAQAISEARGLARGLAPLRLDADGLMSALKELAAGTKSIYGITCGFACPQPVLISDRPTAIHLYRIVQEAVQNAIKHGKPTSVVIDLTKAADIIRLEVSDDGRGLPKDFMSRGGMGLKIMDYRCKTIGAVLDFRRPASGGTVLSCSLPAMRWNTRAI
jgi:PAS domain S-box-containing protein